MSSKDMTGQQFGRLTVVKGAGSDNRGNAMWECRCSCGTVKVIRGSYLRNGNTKSCGCLRRARAQKQLKGFKTHPRYKDGLSVKYNVEYHAFINAKHRCNDLKNSQFYSYGGRGIQFKFKSFREFLNHIGPKPSLDLSLDRINNDGHYEKDNVRWTDAKTQANNRRN